MADAALSFELDQRAKHMKEAKRTVLRSAMSIGKIAELLRKADAEGGHEQVQKMVDSVMRLDKVAQTLEHQNTALTEVKDKLHELTHAQSAVQTFENRVGELEQQDNANAKRKRSQLVEKALSTELKQMLCKGEPSQGDDDDDELVVQQGDEQETCQISMVPLTEPIMNHCGHKFNKPELDQWMLQQKRKNRQITCPVAGCSKLLDEKTFKVDEFMQYDIDQRKKRKRKGEEVG